MISEIVGLVSGIFKPAAELVDSLHTSSEEKMILQAKILEIKNTLTSKYIDLEGKTVDAKRDIMVEELKQDHNYTKRARPTVVYAGLLILFINHVLLPWVAYFWPGMDVPIINLPSEFWLAWGGVCGVYALGRSKEKSGKHNV